MSLKADVYSSFLERNPDVTLTTFNRSRSDRQPLHVVSSRTVPRAAEIASQKEPRQRVLTMGVVQALRSRKCFKNVKRTENR